MKKYLLITPILLASALNLCACGEVTVSEIEDGKATASYTIQSNEIMDYDSSVYYSDMNDGVPAEESSLNSADYAASDLTDDCSFDDSAAYADPITDDSLSYAEPISDDSASFYSDSSDSSAEDSSCNSDSYDSANSTDSGSGYVYYQIDTRKKKSILADSNGYESSKGSAQKQELFAEIDGSLMNAFGCSYSAFHDYSTLYTMDELDSLYGLENYSLRANEILLMKQTGSAPLNDQDTCIGAFGWLSRIFVFEHEYSASVGDFVSALKDTYPDCTDLQFSNKSILAYTPSNIGDSLGYVEFTVPFCMTGNTKVRLYIEASSADSGVSSDTWVFLCKAE